MPQDVREWGQGGRTIVRHTAETANKLPTTRNPTVELVDVGAAPRTPRWQGRAEVHNRRLLLGDAVERDLLEKMCRPLQTPYQQEDEQ